MSRVTRTRRSFVRSIGAGGALLAATGVASAHGRPRNFRTHLSGENVVPPVETTGQGQAVFQLNKDGDALSYKLNVANIKNVIGAHIHHAPDGHNGKIVVFLYGDPFAAPITTDGTLTQGTITSKDVVGPFSKDFGKLLNAIQSGDAYVLVHTKKHKEGAIRGQIR